MKNLISRGWPIECRRASWDTAELLYEVSTAQRIMRQLQNLANYLTSWSFSISHSTKQRKDRGWTAEKARFEIKWALKWVIWGAYALTWRTVCRFTQGSFPRAELEASTASGLSPSWTERKDLFVPFSGFWQLLAILAFLGLWMYPSDLPPSSLPQTLLLLSTSSYKITSHSGLSAHLFLLWHHFN